MSHCYQNEHYLDFLIKLGVNKEQIKQYYNLEKCGSIPPNLFNLVNRIKYLNNCINNLSDIEYSYYATKMYTNLKNLINQFNTFVI